MRIPLDLYQILGVPIQATPEQIQQAFEDRQQQLPRQQYSMAAIAARKQLLQDAYAVLSDLELRETYDKNILEDDSADTASKEEGMELEESQLVGASMLLLEQGEYELIFQLGDTYLNRSIDLNRLPAADAVSESDVILTMALAYMGSGREKWQQKQFEPAAYALNSGLDLLLREQLFTDIQQEIRTDLHKLRPYRVLELLALPTTQQDEREQGFTLLREMLDERGGIDGTQDDDSGLSVDNFLRFVQQLRSDLTVEEQQILFEQEAKRPSAVAAYLSVYALVAHGFSQGTPTQIKQAQTILNQLAERQDVYVEQAMCSLLLGQPQAATQVLQLSQDEESLDFIRQYSAEAPDLIPGLYLYTERWLQQEVYPYFRDLHNQKISLENYFNDQHIQQALNELSPDPAPVIAVNRAATLDAPPEPVERALTTGEKTEILDSLSLPQVAPAAVGKGSTSTLQQRPAKGGSADQVTGVHPKSPQPGSPRTSGEERLFQRKQQLSVPRQRRRLPWAGALVLGLIGIGGLVMLLQRCTQQAPQEITPVASSPPITNSPTPEPAPITPGSNDTTNPSATGGSSSNLSTSPSPRATPTPPAQNNDRPLSNDGARQIIQIWQDTKAIAMGKNHDSKPLETILAEPVLSEWRTSAKTVASSNSYWKYTLANLEVESVKPQGANRASVIARVKETAQLYEQDQLQPDNSYTDNYQVKYDLIRQDNQWRIQDMQVLQ